MLPTPTDCSSNSMRTYTSTAIAVSPLMRLGPSCSPGRWLIANTSETENAAPASEADGGRARAERLFGRADPDGVFGVHGAPRWKQRALYDPMKDAAAAVGQVRLARISIYDTVEDVALHDVLYDRAHVSADAHQPLPRPYRVQSDAFGLNRYLQDDPRRGAFARDRKVYAPPHQQSSPVHVVVLLLRQTSSAGNSHRHTLLGCRTGPVPRASRTYTGSPWRCRT
jgi:hypothetical protein